MKPPKGHSFSRIDTFSAICERRYFFDCFAPPEESTALAKGSQVHALFEQAARAGWPPACTLTLPPGPHAPHVLQSYYDRARPLLDTLTPIGVEIWFESRLRGKIDLVSSTSPDLDSDGYVKGKLNVPVVIDWKTIGPGKSGKTAWETRKSLQLLIYAIQTNVPRAAFVYLPEAGPVYTSAVEFTPEELVQARRWLEMEMDVIEKRWAGTEGADDPSQFALADPIGRNGYLCHKKFCRHWDKCLGKPLDTAGAIV